MKYLSDLKKGDEILRCGVRLVNGKFEYTIFDETKILAPPGKDICSCKQYMGANRLNYHPESYLCGGSIGDDVYIRGWSHKEDLDILKDKLSKKLDHHIKSKLEELQKYTEGT